MSLHEELLKDFLAFPTSEAHVAAVNEIKRLREENEALYEQLEVYHQKLVKLTESNSKRSTKKAADDDD